MMNWLKKIIRKKDLPLHEMLLLAELEKRIGYVFKNISLLKKALSHKSYTHENHLSFLHHNERFEFLGDAVLELIISDLLMVYFPDSQEGELSKMRASLVNEKMLAEQARQINLGRYLFLSRGEEQCAGREKDSLLADAFEAMLGAIYLDCHFDKSFRVLKNMFAPLLLRATKEDISRDYKTKLQEETQNSHKMTPQYRLVEEIGPDHDKTFEIHVYIADKKVSTGRGKSKKQAEQLAAKNALELMNHKTENNHSL